MRIVSFIILLSIFISCSNNEPLESKKKPSIFHGEILNNSSDEVRIESFDTSYFCQVSPEGKFRLNLDLREAGFYKYTGNEFTNIFLAPGEILELKVDAIDWRSFDNSLTYSGTIGSYNNYLFEKWLKIDDLYTSQINELFKLNSDPYLSIIDSISNSLNTSFMEYSRYNDLDNNINEAEQESIRYFKLGALSSYCLTRTDSIPSVIHTNTNQLFNLLDMENPVLKTYPDVLLALHNYMIYSASVEGAEGPKQVFIESIIQSDLIIREHPLKYSLVKFMLDKHLDEGPWDPGILRHLEQKISQELLDQIKIFTKDYSSFAEGEPAPNFKLFDKEGKPWGLNHFDGKYIYMDVWTSYCGPCLREAPAFEELKTELAQQNIVFLSVSLDRKEKDWITTMKKHEMTGIQLIADNDWSSDFARDYYVNHYGIPYYIIIDPDGFIYKIKAPKPSKIKGELQDLLRNQNNN